jgi:uncharacterized protein YoxC
LIDAGHDNYAKVAALGEEGLKQFKGINPKTIPSILEQAAQLAKEDGNDREARVEALKEFAAKLRQSVQDLTTSAREHLSGDLSKKAERKITDALVDFLVALEKVEGKAHKRIKRTGRGLAKAGARLEGLAEGNLKSIRKGLKRAKKSLQRVNA